MTTGAVPVLVAGGGIGGLSSALALARRGIRVRVLEPAAAFGEIGAGIQLAPNASRVLDALGVLEAVSANAVFPDYAVMSDALSAPHPACDKTSRPRPLHANRKVLHLLVR